MATISQSYGQIHNGSFMAHSVFVYVAIWLRITTIRLHIRNILSPYGHVSTAYNGVWLRIAFSPYGL